MRGRIEQITYPPMRSMDWHKTTDTPSPNFWSLEHDERARLSAGKSFSLYRSDRKYTGTTKPASATDYYNIDQFSKMSLAHKVHRSPYRRVLRYCGACSSLAHLAPTDTGTVACSRSRPAAAAATPRTLATRLARPSESGPARTRRTRRARASRCVGKTSPLPALLSPAWPPLAGARPSNLPRPRPCRCQLHVACVSTRPPSPLSGRLPQVLSDGVGSSAFASRQSRTGSGNFGLPGRMAEPGYATLNADRQRWMRHANGQSKGTSFGCAQRWKRPPGPGSNLPAVKDTPGPGSCARDPSDLRVTWLPSQSPFLTPLPRAARVAPGTVDCTLGLQKGSLVRRGGTTCSHTRRRARRDASARSWRQRREGQAV